MPSALDNLKTLGKSIKESGETGLFSVLSNHPLTETFKASPAHYFLFPFIALGMTINWTIQTVEYYRSRNKSIFNTTAYVALTVITALALTSILGTVILGEFVVGPFLFVAALSIGIVSQIASFISNGLKALNSPLGSSQRIGFYQAMAKNVLNAALIALTMALVITAMITPAGPVVLGIIGITAATATLATLAWHFLPKAWKHSIKKAFGFGKKSYEDVTERQELEDISTSKITQTQEVQPARTVIKDFNLFKQENQKLEIARVAKADPKTARFMLENAIRAQVAKLSEQSPHHIQTGEQRPKKHQHSVSGKYYESNKAFKRGDKPLAEQATTKQGQKIEVLAHLRAALNNLFENGSECNATQHHVKLKSIEKLVREHPRAFQSFFHQKSYTESLYDSVKFFIDNYKDELKSEIDARLGQTTALGVATA